MLIMQHDRLKHKAEDEVIVPGHLVMASSSLGSITVQALIFSCVMVSVPTRVKWLLLVEVAQ